MLRALKTTATLLFFGGLAGAIGGALGPVIGLLVISSHSPGFMPYWTTILTNAGLFGAMCGVVVSPVMWWIALRAIPVWRGATETALGTSFAASFTVGLTSWNGYSVLAMGIVGAALAALRLRREFLGD